PPRFGGMKTYNWEGVNPDGYYLDKIETIPSALPSFQKLFQVSATALSIPFFLQAEDGIRSLTVTGVQTCALPISSTRRARTAIRTRSPRRATSARPSAAWP